MLRTTHIALSLALPLSLGAGALSAAPALTTARAEMIASDLLDTRFLAHEDGDTDLVVTRARRDDLQMAHVRVQQRFAGIPVYEGEAIVHLARDGRPMSITDHLFRNVQIDPVPRLLEADAVAIAMLEDDRLGEYTAEPQTDLVIFARNAEPTLTWRVQLRQEDGSPETAMPVFFIDAHRGEVVFRYDNLQTVQGSGVSLYSGTVAMETTKFSTKYYMEDGSRLLGTFDMKNGSFTAYYFTDANNVWDTNSQKAGVDAHYGARMVYEYYLNTFGRRGIDGNGGPGYYSSYGSAAKKLISSRVHYGRNYNNAYWSGQYMTYGDGDGSTFSPLVTVDIAGHEMTHGVTQYEAGLTYSGESGALNESMSDVFGTLVEFYAFGSGGNWQIGEDCYTPSTAGDALRDMSDPHLDPNYGYTTDDDPDHYSERYLGTGDSGGVHINSGIGNKAFYLLSEGGTHHMGGSMVGIGKETAGRIWYKALTDYMTAGTNFSQARQATLDAATALYGNGSPQYNAVASAWSLCGVQ